MMTHAMTCEAFDERLADYLEGEIAPADRRTVEAHLASCLRCAALVRDIDGLRAEASALPELAPSRDLWDAIAERIEAPVVPLVPPARVSVVARRRRPMDRMRLAAVAAGLVAVTAGVTYRLTVAGIRGAASPEQVASVTRPDSSSTDTGRTAVQNTAPTSDLLVSADTTSASPAEAGTSPAGATAQAVRNAPASVTYSREVDRLRAIFARNRYQLDPRTAAIIEANLKVIDEAIAQSKAALSQDPASRFLNEQLNSALDKKLELLRTAALLPQRT